MANGAVHEEDRFAVGRRRAHDSTVRMRQDQAHDGDSRDEGEPYYALQATPPMSNPFPETEASKLPGLLLARTERIYS